MKYEKYAKAAEKAADNKLKKAFAGGFSAKEEPKKEETPATNDKSEEMKEETKVEDA